MDLNKIIDEIINIWIENIKNLNKGSFHKLKNDVYKNYKLEKPVPSIKILERYNELIESWKVEDNNIFKKILRRDE